MIAVRRMVRPLKNWNSWTLLVFVVALWGFARLIIPGPGGAYLPGLWLPSCPLRTLTGIPCPFCGITTGCAWMARGNIVDAWRCSILSPAVMAASLVLGLYVLFFRLIAGRSLVLSHGSQMRRVFWVATGAAIAASWMINLLRI